MLFSAPVIKISSPFITTLIYPSILPQASLPLFLQIGFFKVPITHQAIFCCIQDHAYLCCALLLSHQKDGQVNCLKLILVERFPFTIVFLLLLPLNGVSVEQQSICEQRSGFFPLLPRHRELLIGLSWGRVITTTVEGDMGARGTCLCTYCAFWSCPSSWMYYFHFSLNQCCIWLESPHPLWKVLAT